MALDIQANFKAFATDETYVKAAAEIMINSIAEDDINSLLKVIPDVSNGAPLAVVDQLDKVTKTDAGAGDNSITKSIGGFQQKWDVRDLGVHIKWAWSDFQSTFITFGMNKGIRKADLTSSDLGDFLESLGNNAIKRDFSRIALMANESAATVSGGGYFNDAGVDVADYNMLDKGLSATLDYLSTVGRFQKNFVYIPQNEITARQYQFDGLNGTKKVSDIAIELEDLAVDFDPNHQICNHKMIQGFKKELRDAGSFPTDATRDMLTNGVSATNINGYSTSSSKVYDRYTKNDTTGIFSGAGAGDVHNPNFMILTEKDNLLMGMDSENAISDIEWFRDPIRDEVHFKCKYRADFKVANPDKLLVASSYDPTA
tara:strand:+ start:5061 stop:6173 length:1113 start_codon:yes stop_codon:yes gene_type:complete